MLLFSFELLALALPFFYINQFEPSQKVLTLDEDTSRHVVQVLRMQQGEKLNLTDGKGCLITAEIAEVHKKHCQVAIKNIQSISAATRKITIAISLVKNNSRFEWFLEKATEIGVSEIIPLICERTEKQKFRSDRMKNILVSAMLQSQQCWLPEMGEPISFKVVVEQANQQQKFIAHCTEKFKRELSGAIDQSSNSSLILIGPEGDFTEAEIDLALNHQFIPVALGENRLRTETAGMVAATILTIG